MTEAVQEVRPPAVIYRTVILTGQCVAEVGVWNILQYSTLLGQTNIACYIN